MESHVAGENIESGYEEAKVTTIRAYGKKLLAPIGADGDFKGSLLLLLWRGARLHRFFR